MALGARGGALEPLLALVPALWPDLPGDDDLVSLPGLRARRSRESWKALALSGKGSFPQEGSFRPIPRGVQVRAWQGCHAQGVLAHQPRLLRGGQPLRKDG